MLIQTKHSGYQNGIRLYRIGQGDSDSIGTDAAVASNAAADAAAAANAASPGSSADNPFTRVSDAVTRNIPVVDRTYGVGVGNTQFTQQQINDALSAELAARPNTTYGQMSNFAQQRYGLSPEQVQRAYDAIQGVVTTSNQPSPGGIYSFFPAQYQPVRYTPQYDQYGQGIASLFGRGYSQYFQPPGLTGNYFFGSQPGGGNVPGGGFTYVPPGGTGTIIGGLGNGTITGGTGNNTITGGTGTTTTTTGGTGTTTTTGGTGTTTTVQIPAGFTAEQAARYIKLAPADRPIYEGLVSRYNAPGSVQSDAASIRAFMDKEKLSINEVARIAGWNPEGVQSYLGQEGLTEEQLARYQTPGLSAADQSIYSKLAGFFNAPGTPAEDAAQMAQFIQQNKLTTADVERLTGIPVNAINAYLLQAPTTASSGIIALPAGQITTATSTVPATTTGTATSTSTVAAPAPGFNQGVYDFVTANINDPGAIYNAMLSAGADTGQLATALGIPESQVVSYFDAAGYGREST